MPTNVSCEKIRVLVLGPSPRVRFDEGTGILARVSRIRATARLVRARLSGQPAGTDIPASVGSIVLGCVRLCAAVGVSGLFCALCARFIGMFDPVPIFAAQ